MGPEFGGTETSVELAAPADSHVTGAPSCAAAASWLNGGLWLPRWSWCTARLAIAIIDKEKKYPTLNRSYSQVRGPFLHF